MGFFSKIIEVYNRQTFVQSKESWTFYRFFVFFFSVKGQKRIFKFIGKILRFAKRKIIGGKNEQEHQYAKWRKRNTASLNDLSRFKKEQKNFIYRPKISILLPVYNPKLEYFKFAVESVLNQVYKNWELCISDDCSTDQEVKNYLKELEQREPSIKINYRKTNGHISTNSNDAAALATGEFISLLDQDDLYSLDALFHIVKGMNEDQVFDIVYSDEDKINAQGWHVQPCLKPEWSPDTFLSRNYICHITFLKKELFDKIGGFRKGLEGSQDYDLLLRATELTTSIKRIPKTLYHWRMHDESTSMNESAKNYAFESGKTALQDAFERRNIEATVIPQKNKPGFYHIDYALDQEPKISIIIPTKNNSKVLQTCIGSIFKKSTYSNFEVIILDNNSNEPELFELFKEYESEENTRFRVLKLAYLFNFSKLMNDGVAAANGDYILLLNNDTEVITPDWMEKMLKHAQRKNTGAVGVKLYYPNDLIQHAGVVIGLGEVAGHTFVAAERNDPGYFHRLTSVNNYSAVTAACLLIAKEKYLSVQGFDERLAIEYNDVDFCLKLVDSGLLNVWLPEVELYHYESLTRGHPHANKKTYAQSLKEIKYFKSKWMSYIEDDPMYHPSLSRLSTFYDLK